MNTDVTCRLGKLREDALYLIENAKRLRRTKEKPELKEAEFHQIYQTKDFLGACVMDSTENSIYVEETRCGGKMISYTENNVKIAEITHVGSGVIIQRGIGKIKSVEILRGNGTSQVIENFDGIITNATEEPMAQNLNVNKEDLKLVDKAIRESLVSTGLKGADYRVVAKKNDDPEDAKMFNEIYNCVKNELVEKVFEEISNGALDNLTLEEDEFINIDDKDNKAVLN